MEDFEILDSPEEDYGIKIELPSGVQLTVLTEAEKDYINYIHKRYLEDNHLTNISDLADLDRILIMELLTYRWGLWLATEEDYAGRGVDMTTLQKNVSDYSREIRLLKKQLGIDKASRDKERGESVVDYIENLKIRAKEFGIMRNKQAVEAITLFQQLSALITLYNNCTLDERKENSVTEADIIEWLNETAIPEFESVDKEFKSTSQKYWIHNQ